MTGSLSPGSQTSSMPLGQPADGDVDDAELGQRPAGGGDLRGAAVDDQQVRRVGEPARPALLGGDCPARRGRSCLVLEVPGEPAAHDLGHRGGVVGALRDGEAPVVGLLGQPVLEDDHAGDHVGALDVRDVDALDPQRRVGQLERLLQLGQREATGRSGRWPA